MPPKGYVFGPETRKRMSESHKGKPRNDLKKDPRTTLLTRHEKTEGVDPCWLWLGAIFKGTGYPQIQFQGKPCRGNRVSWTVFKGPIPKGAHVLHTCDNRSCINPDHLFLGSHKVNMDDMRSKGRDRPARGERVGSAKMTDDKVREARRLWKTGKWTAAKLGRKYGITHVPMKSLLEQRTWKHVED